jgi:uncharacterized membrane protein
VPDRGADDLPALVARLGEDVLTLVDSKLTLLKVELKEDLTAYARSSLAFGTGGLLAGVGFALLNVAVAFLMSALFARTDLSAPVAYALGFLLTGATYLIAGAAVVKRAKTKLTEIDVSEQVDTALPK